MLQATQPNSLCDQYRMRYNWYLPCKLYYPPIPHVDLFKKSDQIISYHIISDQIRSNQTTSNQIKSNQIKSNQIKSNQIKPNQIKSNQIPVNSERL